ncbi:MAG: tannase/feruloyl esterase family alpha/beta hydrolase, partial [Vicinamibacterales bacterium]
PAPRPGNRRTPGARKEQEMQPKRFVKRLLTPLVVIAGAAVSGACTSANARNTADADACRALVNVPNLTIVSADLRTVSSSTTTEYCYVKGLIPPSTQWHAQLPLPANWNERFLKWGDGGKDGSLNVADHRVAQGYAVANSNSGHDNGSEPGASFGWNNRQSEIDFGYRSVHLTITAAKTLVKAYYDKDPEYSYFEGCSTGGRQGLMEAQRFPRDFDGIVAGDPVNYYAQINIAQIWKLQRVYRNNLAGSLVYDANGDGKPDSLTKLSMLRDAVLAKCDALDGITDRVVDDPAACRFDPAADLAGTMCPGDVNADNCFTKAQVQTITDFHRGPHDSKGKRVFWGASPGSEFDWAHKFFPTPRNNFVPSFLGGSAGDHLNYLFYEQDPGLPPSNLTDLHRKLNKAGHPPEWAWWEFNVDDFTAGKGQHMMSLMDATDPDLRPFLVENKGKLILYHGWGDSGVSPEGTVTYYKDVVKTSFGDDMQAAREHARLFMFPGMGHCRGGPGPNEWDRLAALVNWVEKGQTLDFVVATHSTDGKVDNERPVCAYPQRAVYTGPAGGQNDPQNWVARNFACR